MRYLVIIPMPLHAGDRLGAYEIVAPLGAGGMGEVYRARDSRLKREVALKILPESFAADPDRLARFQREAEVLAALNHPHVAAIYGLEDAFSTSSGQAGPARALVLELVEGETLSERIARGPIPVDEALATARQIADGLQAAHEQGIIHRDLKPANIKVTPDGVVKILDFGLARLSDPANAIASSSAATLTSPALMTSAGMILGTAAYMSPEQAKGRLTDKRSDVWAFGCVLFEMLAGKRAFEGDDVTDTIAAIMRGEPDWRALPADMPANVRTVIERCIKKERKLRIADIAVAQFLLDEDATQPSPSMNQVAARASVWRRVLPWTAGFAIGIVVAGAAAWTLRSPSPSSPIVTRFSIPLGEGQRFANAGRQGVAMSPDGTQVVYVANQRLYLRSMADVMARPISRTETFNGVTSPVFSPDGRSIVFWANADSTIKKIALTGGAPVTVCEADNPLGMSWVGDQILFVQSQSHLRGIVRVSAEGGKPELLVSLKEGELAYGPQLLPEGDAVLFTIVNTGAVNSNWNGNWDQGRIVVQRLKSGDRTTLVEGGTDGRYLSSGHLVYALGGVLFAVPFDAGRLRVTGAPVSIVEGVLRTGGFSNGAAAQFSVSSSGSLAYVPGPATATVVNPPTRTMVWVDRQGHEEPLKAPPRAYTIARLSPDGTRVALEIADQNMDIWIWDLARAALTRLTTDAGREALPEWTPDGRRVIFMSPRDGSVENLYAQAADGSGQPERLTTSPNRQTAHTPSPDGTQWVFSELDSRGHSDLMLLRLDGFTAAGGSITHRVEPLFRSSFDALSPALSPDGHWLAYTSDESGENEIYVRPFPNINSGKWQVSTGGGTRALWARSGRELFYATSSALMSVAVQTTPTFRAGRPVKLFDSPDVGRTRSGNPTRSYDVSADGKRFLMIQDATAGENAPVALPSNIVVTLNWLEEVKARVPRQ